MGIGVATATIPFLLLTPLELRVFLGIPYIALQNAMVCKVFRELKLGMMVDVTVTSNRQANTRRLQLPLTTVHLSDVSMSSREGRDTTPNNGSEQVFELTDTAK